VGLSGMVVADCQALSQIATLLGHTSDAAEITARGEQVSARIQQLLWHDHLSIFINRRPDTMDFVPRLTPTLFYPMMAGIASVDQADRMIRLHLSNSSEFCVNDDEKACPFALPSCAASDPAFKDNDYWRGRIWGAMNFLIYLGLRHDTYRDLRSVAAARRSLATQSARLILKSWAELGHVQENYNAVTGVGCDVWNADPFYHWGALNSLIKLMEDGADV